MVKMVKKTDAKQRLKPSLTKLLLSFTLGLLSLALLLLLVVEDPLPHLIRYGTRLTNGSTTYKFLQKKLDKLHLSMYLFNITNAEQFMIGEEYRLRVQEIGPFTYKEIRSNGDLELDDETGILRYKPRIDLVFLPDESIARPEDVNVTMLNLPMLGLTSKMNDYPYFVRFGFNMLTSQLHSKAIVTTNASSYMWGYHEPLVSLAHTVIPGFVQFKEMGILNRLFDKNQNNHLELYTTDDEKYKIKSRNGHKKLVMSENENPDECEKCSTFENAYEGYAYPSGLTPEFPVRLFRSGLCKILDLEFNRTKTLDSGAEVLVYHFSNSFYSNPNETSNGILELPECFFGLPLALSKAHFLDVDPKLYDRIEGIHPNETAHRGWISIEPKIGMELETVFSLQINLVIRDVDHNSETKSFSDMVVPVCYMKIEQQGYTEDCLAAIKLVYLTAPRILLAMQMILYLTTFVIWAYFGCAMYRYCGYSENILKELKRKRKKKQEQLSPVLNVEVPLVVSNLLKSAES